MPTPNTPETLPQNYLVAEPAPEFIENIADILSCHYQAEKVHALGDIPKDLLQTMNDTNCEKALLSVDERHMNDPEYTEAILIAHRAGKDIVLLTENPGGMSPKLLEFYVSLKKQGLPLFTKYHAATAIEMLATGSAPSGHEHPNNTNL